MAKKKKPVYIQVRMTGKQMVSFFYDDPELGINRHKVFHILKHWEYQDDKNRAKFFEKMDRIYKVSVKYSRWKELYEGQYEEPS